MLRILLIDDQPELILEILKFYGNDVYVAKNGFEALERLCSHEDIVFELIILDVVMPGMDGWEVLKYIRDHGDYAHIPVIMLTSCKEDKHIVRGLRRGADYYLSKPVEPSILYAHLDAVSRRIQWHEPIKKSTIDENPLKVLSDREKEILKCICQGLSNSDIAAVYNISLHTVKNHVIKILSKLNANNRAHAAVIGSKLTS